MQKGFSLLELMVVIIITASVVGVIIPQINRYNKLEVLQDAANQLQTSVKVAQNNAVSGVVCNNTASGKANNWQLAITSSTTYQITASCQVGVTPPVTNYKLPEGVSINNSQVVFDGICNAAINAGSGLPKAIFNNITGETNFHGGTGCPSVSYKKMAITLKHNSVANEPANVVIEKGSSGIK